MVTNPFLTFVTLIQNDQRILNITHELALCAAETGRIQKSIDERLAAHALIEKSLHTLRAEIKNKELEDKHLQERDRSLRVKFEETGSTKEYISLEHALSENSVQRKKIEELVFELWDKRDALEPVCAEDKKATDLFTEQQHTVIHKNEVRARELQVELDGLHEKRQSLEKGSPIEYVEKYESMRKSVENPIVTVINGACAGCSFQLHAADLISLKRHILVPCKECFRLLYLV